MRNKFINASLGSLISLFLIIPPSIGKIFGFEYSDIPFILFLGIISILSLKKLNFEKSDLIWLLIASPFILSLIFFGVNYTTFRFIAYIFFGFLIKKYVQANKSNNFIWFFLPMLLVIALNFIVFLLQESFLENTIGWISNYSDQSNIFLTGRLAGFQGSGPNVAGALFGIFTILNFYLYKTYQNKVVIFFTFLNLLLFLITFSRGSYLAFLIVVLMYIFITKKDRKFRIVYISSLLSFVILFLYFGPSSVILKENDRSLLANIALENIKLIDGVGGGNYVEEIFKPYLLSVNPNLLEDKFKISLNKVELGITPEEYRNEGVDFFIGTSGGGYEILQQYFLADKCSDDRNTCQYLRVDEPTLKNYLKIFIPDNDFKVANAFDFCKQGEGLVTRGDYACIAYELKLLGENYVDVEFIDIISSSDLSKHFSYIYSNNLFVECESSKSYTCNDRPLAIGELSVVIEKLFIASDTLTEDNLKNICNECNFRDINGFIKIKYDRYDYFLPRSKIEFYTSSNGTDWKLVGYPHYTGEVINFRKNVGRLEVGGYVDGQSFGNTWLEGYVKSVEIINGEKYKKINFDKENLNKDYYIFKINSLLPYEGQINISEKGLELLRPNKYWVAIENDYNFQKDFEIVIELTIPEIPWETQTLISDTSALNGGDHSWRVDIDDGRMFFKWTNENGEYVYQLGDFSLRSGVLTQKNGQLFTEKPPLANTSFLSQLTTAHNGYLTLFVEYGLLFGLTFYLFVFYLTLRGFRQSSDKKAILLYLILIFVLIHNNTNDLFYSPDITILFYFILGFKESMVDLEDSL